MKSRLFKMAWAIRANFQTFGEALSHAWKVVKLQFDLCTKPVLKFSYMKKDGSRRDAIGTVETVPAIKGVRPVNFGLLTYFDLEAQDWRSAQIQNLLF